MSEKIQPHHTEREAYVYIRQSSMQQVRTRLEGQRRQYDLRERAQALGFQRVTVIDEDLGRSGTGSVERPGFGRLLTAVCAGQVGAVLALEASRLARNNCDWHHLIDLCAMAGTLVIDHDGVYDPCLLNDRLLLGLKGTMSEFEISLLRQRAMEAHRQKVRRGLVLTQVPVGYVRTEDEGIEKTPDRQIQEAITGIFRKFRELGSVRQVMLCTAKRNCRSRCYRANPATARWSGPSRFTQPSSAFSRTRRMPVFLSGAESRPALLLSKAALVRPAATLAPRNSGKW